MYILYIFSICIQDQRAVVYQFGSQLDLVTPTQKKPMFR